MTAEPRSSELERLYREDGPRLWRSLLGFTGDPEVASDSMAEAFAEALGRGDAVRDHDRWIWRAAFRIASGEMQRRSKLQPLAGEGSSFEMQEAPTAVLALLRQLPTKQRAVLVLRSYAGYSTREVATILGSTTGTVRMHLSQGRKRLRRLMEEDNARAE